jgi:hypothetical protein
VQNIKKISQVNEKGQRIIYMDVKRERHVFDSGTRNDLVGIGDTHPYTHVVAKSSAWFNG